MIINIFRVILIVVVMFLFLFWLRIVVREMIFKVLSELCYIRLVKLK